MSTRFKESERLLERALKIIPLGSQTFSKSKSALPWGVSPFYADRAKGSRFWDVDGNEFIDFVNGLCCITLGHRDSDIDAAVLRQMESGIIFSLPHRLEMELAELLVEHIPCAEMVRFSKNGTDATSGAIRLARACTGRERVAVCGYHGWQDWYIGSTTRDLGVPKSVKMLTHQFLYNDLDSLESLLHAHPNEFAAIILEPMNVSPPQEGFLEGVRSLASEYGALLVFDETITGFRYHIGGAQAYFGVTPDLATFGKGIANGYPLSALVGRACYMTRVEEIFFSGTFGGETLSLAAGKAVLKKLVSEPVIETLAARGQQIVNGVEKILDRIGLSKQIGISGHPSWSFLQFRECAPYSVWQVKTLFIQEVLKRGVYTLGTHNLSYAHSDEDVTILLACYEEVFALIANCLSRKNLEYHLECEPLEPLFKLR